MILSSSLKKSLFISMLGHFVLFGMFSFSFGKKIPTHNYPVISFWGQILFQSELGNNPRNYTAANKRQSFINAASYLSKDKPKAELDLKSSYLKPDVKLAFSGNKFIFLSEAEPAVPPDRSKKESVIMIHPILPRHFALYFKDRQIVHMELMFKVLSGSPKNSILIKRKISSGNLEADLISMRYMGHYLFIQEKKFPLDTWKTVKIDLSAKDD